MTEPGSGKGRFSPTASFPGVSLQFVQLINPGEKFSFYSFHKTTGTATPIGGTGLGNLVKAAGFNPSNVLYALQGGGGVDNTHFRWLDTCDVSTGTRNRVGQITANDLDALAFIPLRR